MGIDRVSEWTLRKTIPSVPAVGSALVDELIDAMNDRQWPSEELFRVQLAYEEAIVNAISHGNQNDPDKTVQVEMVCGDQRVWIRITDQGSGFDPESLPDPRQDDLLESLGGRGVLLIHEIMSEVRYNEPGNQITMIKVRNDRRPALGED